MLRFTGKILIIGCGGVAQCVLPLLLKIFEITPSQLTVIDALDKREQIEKELKLGIHFKQLKITQENYQDILRLHLTRGDLCIDLAWNIDTLALLQWCHDYGVHYLNTSLEIWDTYENYHKSDPRELTLYHRQMALRKMIQQWPNQQTKPTAIIDHGANPGLVSHFTKQGLIDIATQLLTENISEEWKDHLEKALADNHFSFLAYLTNLKTIHISERDSQISNHPKKMNEFVNTWSIVGFIEEGLAPSEIGWGTHEYKVPHGTLFHENGPCNQICLPQIGFETWARSWVPSGEILGMVIRHGEAFSLSDYLTIWKGKELIYRPTVHYVYCPCDAALSSIHELKMHRYSPQSKQRILTDEIIEGKDELGCLLMGHHFNSWWIGSVLDIQETRRLVSGQNATTLQVAIGAVSAAAYIIRNPQKGVCLPEDLDHHQILSIAKPYLGHFISEPVNGFPLKNSEKIEFDEGWQFAAFQTSFKELDFRVIDREIPVKIELTL